MSETEFELTGDLVDDSVKLIASSDVPKTIVPGRLDDEDVFVLTAILDDPEKGEFLVPIAVIMNDSMHDRFELPESIQEIPPAMPDGGFLNG